MGNSGGQMGGVEEEAAWACNVRQLRGPLTMASTGEKRLCL